MRVTAVRPFGSWRSPNDAQIDSGTPASTSASPPSQKQMQMQMTMMAGGSTPTLSATLPTSPTHTHAGLSPAPSAPYLAPSVPDSTPTERLSSSERASSGVTGRPARSNPGPQVVQTVDSGLRLAAAGEAVMLPPPYTRE